MLAICCSSLLLVSMDNTIVNVALPAIRTSFDASLAGLQWTVDAYVLVLASLLMLAGSTGDRIGRKRTFLIGLAVFTLASAGCSLAPSLGWLIAARMLQAVGGSMLNPVAMSIITNVFTDARERAQAIGVWGAVVGLSLALGPIVGGALTESVGWRAIFLVNVPVGVAALLLASRYVPDSRAPKPRRVDPVGQVLVAVTLVALVDAIITAPEQGWGSLRVLCSLAVAAAALTALLVYEPRRPEPLIDLRFFRSAPFSGATVTAVVAFSAFSLFLFVNTLYLQDVRGFSALEAGLATLPLAVASMACSPLSGRIVSRSGPRRVLVVSGIALGAAGLLLTGLTERTPLLLLLGAYTVFGIGFGLVNAPITNAAVSGMPLAQAGVAAAVASTSRQVGQSLGVAVGGAVIGSAVVGSAVTGSAVAGSALGPTQPFAPAAWWLVVGCGLAVTALGLVTSGRWARATAERVRAVLDPVAEVRA